MKKTLIALAAMAAAGVASAQSSVTLFGIVDATLQRVWNDNGPNTTRLTSAGYNTSRLGFRGTEDLGGGMSASFWLEAGLNNDDGSGQLTSTNNQGATTGGGGLTFNRRSTVSLAGGWGELRVGRDYTPQFWNLTVFDPFGTNGVGSNIMHQAIITGPTSTRASNSIGYLAPANLGGFYGQAQYYLGDNASGANGDNGEGFGVRVGFASGPFNVALALSRTEQAGNVDVDQHNIAGSWDFGMARLMAQFSRDEVGNTDARGWLIGALVPVGAGEIRASFSQYRVDLGATEPRARKLALGYVHNLSKRTAVYTTVARVNNNGAANVSVIGGVGNPTFGDDSTGVDIGIRHAF